MRIPLSWLHDYLEIRLSPEEIAQKLTDLGIESEGISVETPSFSGVVAARVVKVSPHPNADKLCVALVDDGVEQTEVVCGAPNCREGMLTALARIGARLGITDEGCDFEVKKATLRGVDSYGMLCGEDELSLGDDTTGIIELDSGYVPGEDLQKRFSDTVFEVAITPNLGYCLSIESIARELGALLGQEVKIPYGLSCFESKSGGWSVSIEAQDDCPSYAALAIKGVRDKRAPLEMRVRLQRAGMRSVNGPVDCANYVMLSMGQPLHTFDAQAFPEKKIIVSHSKKADTIRLIDGRAVELPEKSLIISNGSRPCAVAGVMGGVESEVGETTEDMIVESAYFDSRATRRSGKAIQTFSEALRRFERGVDPNGFYRALQLFWQLFSKISPENSIEGVVVQGQTEVLPKKVTCRRSRAQSILGVEVPRQSMELVFSRLGYENSWDDHDTLSVQVPAYRHDVSEEIDLIEDVAKFTGLMNYAGEKIEKVSFSHLSDHPLYVYEQTARRVLTSLNLQEFLNCDLISPELVSLVEEQPIAKHAIISVANPMSEEQSVLRPSLLPGFIANLKHNSSFGETTLAAFEVGTVHLRSEGKFTERLVAGVLLSGKRTPYYYSDESEDFDFFDLKGILESLITSLGVSGLGVRSSSISLFHDGRQALVLCGGHQVGMLGEVHPALLDTFDIKERVYFMEIDVQDLFAHVREVPSMKPLARYPSIRRDWTMTVPESLSHQEVMDAVQKHLPKYVEKVELLSVFRHEKLGSDKKNVTLRFIFREPTRTLLQPEVDEAFSEMVQRASQSLGVPVHV